jgi:hypothetical protein
MKYFIVPNSEEFGITGVHSATIQLPLTDVVKAFLDRLVPEARWDGGTALVDLSPGTLRFQDSESVHTTLFARSDRADVRGRAFQLKDVTVRVE